MNTEDSRTILPISIVIPAYSEEVVLPKLLESIKKQIFQPFEVIVADADSPDKTIEIARDFGCVVVKGGKVAVGRNAGAKVAKSDYLLFMDADTSLSTDTMLLEVFSDFVKTECDIASVGYVPEKKGSTRFGFLASTVLFSFWNTARKIQSITQNPSLEGGAFILVKKAAFDYLGGFDVAVALGEDRDFFARAVKAGYRYQHFNETINMSTRRFKSLKGTANAFGAGFLHYMLIGLGVYAGSKLVQKVLSNYGRLGGGKGKDQHEED